MSDSGSGISADNLERIFEPFYTTKGVGHGTGLGLSQVFGFAKQSGGDVQFESVVGEGTVFTLYFPRARSSDTPAQDINAAPTPDLHRAGTVLVVEDNFEVAGAVEASLKELGYATVHAVDAERALKEIDRAPSRFLAVFSDVVMTGMDGVALAHEIRRRWPKMPVLLTSGYSHVLVRDADHGFDVLPKPYDLDSLGKAMLRATSTNRQSLPPSDSSVRRANAITTLLDEAAAETRRQAELDSMQILDTPAEAGFDDLVRLAADICGTPIALMSLVDRDRQWFKAKVGLEASETPRDYAFCAHAIQQPDRTMIVEDATQDDRFASNPLVTGGPHIRFYAGAPLVTSSGEALGTMCVIAPEPRVLEPKQTEILQFVADQAVKRLEQRRARLEGDAGDALQPS